MFIKMFGNLNDSLKIKKPFKLFILGLIHFLLKYSDAVLTYLVTNWNACNWYILLKILEVFIYVPTRS